MKNDFENTTNTAYAGNKLTEKNLLESIDKIKEALITLPDESKLAQAIAMGEFFYTQTLLKVTKDKKPGEGDLKNQFMSWQGLRFYLDTTLPTNTCEFRNSKGECVKRFNWGE